MTHLLIGIGWGAWSVWTWYTINSARWWRNLWSYLFTYFSWWNGRQVSSFRCSLSYYHVILTHRVVFNGSPDGEFWYCLRLVAVDPDPVVMDMMECPLGWWVVTCSTGQQQHYVLIVILIVSNSTLTNPITLVNPHMSPITISPHSANPQNFSLPQDATQVSKAH